MVDYTGLVGEFGDGFSRVMWGLIASVESLSARAGGLIASMESLSARAGGLIASMESLSARWSRDLIPIKKHFKFREVFLLTLRFHDFLHNSFHFPCRGVLGLISLGAFLLRDGFAVV
ncbi:hypothetical protein FITA111629_05330 [Filibacter tadaridae]|uniref:Uncharacterized protein n=1 Tax=Filibacter tadaridae TaxID=2483811 RepID=A0A3P5WVZ9_9BACL|nr:hypothetical protein FILTAD_00210 [Filibacter tadaridae]